MELAALPTAPDGFHYRGQEPKTVTTVDKNGKAITSVSRLARYVPDENKKNLKEKYFDLFCFIRDEGESKKPVCMCTCCGKEVITTYSKGINRQIDISNMVKHWKSLHISELTPKDQGQSEAKAFASSPFEQAKRNSKTGKRSPSEIKTMVSSALAEMIIRKGTFPISMVDDAAFREGVRAILKIFSDEFVYFPTRYTVRRRMVEVMSAAEDEERSSFREALKNSHNSMFAVTNDASTAVNKVPYSVITASVITTSEKPGHPWQLREVYISCSPNEGRHTAIHNANHMKFALKDFLDLPEESEVSQYISVAIFDSGSNTPASTFSQEGVSTIKCFCHRLNTLYEHLDKNQSYKLALAPVYYIMDVIRKSVINLRELSRVQHEGGGKAIRPINGAATRWTYDSRVVRRAKLLHADIKKMDMAQMYFKNAEKRRDWSDHLRTWNTQSVYYIEFLLPLMERIEFWTIFMESGTSVTISLCLYAIDDLFYFLQSLESQVNESATEIPVAVHTMLLSIVPVASNELMQVFSGFNDILLLQVAEILDFRVAAVNNKRSARRDAINNQHPRGWEVHKLLQFYNTHQIARRLFFKNDVEIGANDVAPQEPERPVSTNPFASARTVVDAAAVGNDPDAQKLTAFEKECCEYVSTYLFSDYEKTPTEEARLNRDPLIDQWPQLQDKYPMLSAIAAKVLECPASIAGSERFFSRLTQIVTPQRSSLQKDFAGSIVLASMRYKKSKQSALRRSLKVPTFGVFDASTMTLEAFDVDDEEDAAQDDYVENQEDVLEDVDAGEDEEGDAAADNDEGEEAAAVAAPGPVQVPAVRGSKKRKQ
jgi:hAT family C-terminal dimerisation region